MAQRRALLACGMDLAMSDAAVELVKAKGGTAAIDFIPPTA